MYIALVAFDDYVHCIRVWVSTNKSLKKYPKKGGFLKCDPMQ
jgi:hypothetical protein